MKVILTGFEPLSEGKVSLFVMLLSEDSGKTNKVSRGSRSSSARGGTGGDERIERGRKKVRRRDGFQGAASSKRTSVFFGKNKKNYLSLRLWLKKKKLLQRDNGVSKHFCSHAALCAGSGWKSCACQSERGTTGSSIIFDETLQQALITCLFLLLFFPAASDGKSCVPPLMFV